MEIFIQWQLDQIVPSLTSHCYTSIINKKDDIQPFHDCEFFKNRYHLLLNFISLLPNNLAQSRWSINVLNESINTTVVDAVIHDSEPPL